MRISARSVVKYRTQQKKFYKHLKFQLSEMVSESVEEGIIAKSYHEPPKAQVVCHKTKQILITIYSEFVTSQLPEPNSVFTPKYNRNRWKSISKAELDVISGLLAVEEKFQPVLDILYENSVAEDKVDNVLRDEAILNLRFLHMCIFQLLPDVFSVAVNLIDRFLVKVKVKPKYLVCVVMACYCLAAQLLETKSNQPELECLVDISRCGGSVGDLKRMTQIVSNKLKTDCRPTTALDFLRLFLQKEELQGELISHLDIALCSTIAAGYRTSHIALGLIAASDLCLIPEQKLRRFATLCEISMDDVKSLGDLLRSIKDDFYGRPLPSSRNSLVWTMSKRTYASMSSSSPPHLPTIFEVL